MKGNKVVVAVFSYIDDTLKAIQSAKDLNLDYRVYSPVPNEEIEHATLPQKSNVRRVTLTGALTGLTFGFSLAILCSLDWPIRVSSKDIVSIPGFVVIGYECTILFGALATLFAMLHYCKIPDIFRRVGYDLRFSNDKFGVVVGCDSANTGEVKAKLLGCGADEVTVQDGL